MTAADLPPLAGEDHECSVCGISYPELTVERAVEIVRELPDAIREAAISAPDPRKRPDSETWSVMEYVCHVRDVYASYTIRLYRTRVEDRPAVEPMLNDLRARRFRYNELDLDAVLDELSANVAGFVDEVARVQDWERTATRLPHEERTVRWMVRQATHEGTHHLRDIRRVGN